MRLDKDARNLVAHQGGFVGVGLRVQQATGYIDKLVEFIPEIARLGSDLKALEAAAPGEVPDPVVAATADKLADIAWAAVLALMSMGLSPEQLMGMRREKMLGGTQVLLTEDYVATLRMVSDVGALLARK